MLSKGASLLLVIINLASLTACTGTDDSSPSLPAAEPSLNYSSTKKFDFTWTDSVGAEFYRILEKPDSTSGYAQVGNDIPSGIQSFSIYVPIFKRLNASYILQTCNINECVDSNAVFVTGNLEQSIGYIKATNPGSGDYFGSSISLSGDGNTLAIGAWGEESDTTNITESDTNSNDDSPTSGAVYVFTYENFRWSLQSFIKASNAEAYDWFGYSVSLNDDGNVLVVGAANESSSAQGVNGNQLDNSTSDSGAAYVFIRNDGLWSQNAYLKASNTGENDSFGKAVAISGDGSTIAIGAEEEKSKSSGINGDQTNNNWSNSGAVYVFAKTATSWQQEAYVKASNSLPVSTKFFGETVSLSDNGNTLVVGGSGDQSSATGINGNQSDINASKSGAAYIFTRTNSTWSQQAYVKASNTEANDRFGYNVSISGDGATLAVSAGFEDSASVGVNGDQTDNSANSSGAVYLFSFTNNQWSQQAYLKSSNTEAADEFGSSISLSDDGNLIAIGAASEDGPIPGIGGNELLNSSANSGAVYIFERTNNTWSQLSYVKASNPDAIDLFGGAVSLSDDGDTLAVGANLEDSNGDDDNNNSMGGAGAAYIY